MSYRMRVAVIGTLAAIMLGCLIVSFYLGRYETRTIQSDRGSKMEFVIQLDPLGKLEERIGTSLETLKIVKVGVTVPPRETVWFETEHSFLTFTREKPELYDDGHGTLYTDVGVGAESTAIFAKHDEKGIWLHVDDVSGNELSLYEPWGRRSSE